MEIYQLRYFVVVAETGNFTKAAQRANISQPSLSQQILNLEEELGQKLFHRLPRRVVLTDAGQMLLERARRIIVEADNTLREMKIAPGGGYRVSVGAIQTLAHFFLPAVVAHCRANEIPIRLRSHEDFRETIVNAVLAGELDWGLVALPVSDPRIEVIRLFTEPLLLAVAAAHPLASAERIAFADLRDQNFILLGSASTLTNQVQRIGGDFDFTPVVTHRCAQLATVKSLTAMGLGISILPQSARTANDPAGLVYRKFSGPPPTREIGLIRHRRRHLSRGAELFAEAARAVVGPSPGVASATPTFAPRD
ncbi:MAG TPA: LysR family transcriptional regulator [Opitutaceae bacterium]|nr:LysR family transcriptional regulator [Opitutaceae bacterium]